MNSFTITNNQIMIHFDGELKKERQEKLIVIDEDTYQKEELLFSDFSYERKIMPLDKDIYLMEEKQKSIIDIGKLNNGHVESLQMIKKANGNSFGQPIYCISRDKQWSFFAALDEDKNIGELRIYDFNTFKLIDGISFDHVSSYGMNIEFFEFKNQAYILYQANPEHYKNEQYLSYQKFETTDWNEIQKQIADFDDLLGNEKWYTYIYSISERKIVKEIDHEIYIHDLPKKDLLVIEAARHGNHKKKVSFYYGS